MESYHAQIMKKHSLGISGILKESVKIPIRNPKFIALSVVASLPLFFAMLLHELALQQTLIQLDRALSAPPPHICSNSFCIHTVPGPIHYVKVAIRKVSQIYIFPGLAYLGLLLAADLLAAVAVIDWASSIYVGDQAQAQAHAGLVKQKVQGTWLTGAYVLLLASLTQIGLLWLAGWCAYLGFGSGFQVGFPGLVFWVLLVGLFWKYVEWRGVWEMGMVMSVVEGEEKQGVVAIGVSGYLTRRCRVRGAVLALGFWVWRNGLRLWGLCMVWGVQGGYGVVAVQVGLACVGNVVKWLVFVVYFCDCKKRFLEKKSDAEVDERGAPAPAPAGV